MDEQTVVQAAEDLLVQQARYQVYRQSVERERTCLKDILPTLIEISQAITASELPEEDKVRFNRTLAHTSRHLYLGLKRLQLMGIPEK